MKPSIAIENWAPEYGSPLQHATFEPTDATVDLDVEVPQKDWQPISPAQEIKPAERLIFIDGVRRIEALVWISSSPQTTRQGICASFAAGVVEIGERAKINNIEVGRGIFSAVDIEPLSTRARIFEPIKVAGEEIEQLTMALQRSLGELEIKIAESLKVEAELIVVDGPLTGRQKVPGAIGYVKSHRVTYLPDTLSDIPGKLRPGERTPIFLSTTTWTRYSWYMRLPGPMSHPWSGIVRLEAAGELKVAEVQRLADLSAVTLPKYASVPHKDPRAPQNLFPIAGLERELRHRLGESSFVQRALRQVASTGES